MALQAKIYYWPNVNLGCGHIAVKIFDPNFDEFEEWDDYNPGLANPHNKKQHSYYLSYAMGNIFENDKIVYGNDYITFTLPIVPHTNFDDFLKKIKDTPYYLPDLFRYVALAMCIHERIDKPKKYPLNADDRAGLINLSKLIKECGNEYESDLRAGIKKYQDQYNLITNNCAHCAIFALDTAGYLVSPALNDILIMRPSIVTPGIAELCLVVQDEKINAMLKKSSRGAFDLEQVAAIVEQLALERDSFDSRNIVDGIDDEKTSANLEQDIELLKTLNEKLRQSILHNNNMMEEEALKLLLTTIDDLKNKHIAKILEYCFDKLPNTTNKKKAWIDYVVQDFDKQASLVAEKCPEDKEIMDELKLSLNTQKTTYISDPTDDNYHRLVKKTHNKFASAEQRVKHPTLKTILGNVMLAIVGLGFGYIAAGLTNKYVFKQGFFYKPKTETGRLFDKTASRLMRFDRAN